MEEDIQNLLQTYSAPSKFHHVHTRGGPQDAQRVKLDATSIRPLLSQTDSKVLVCGPDSCVVLFSRGCSHIHLAEHKKQNGCSSCRPSQSYSREDSASRRVFEESWCQDGPGCQALRPSSTQMLPSHSACFAPVVVNDYRSRRLELYDTKSLTSSQNAPIHRRHSCKDGR